MWFDPELAGHGWLRATVEIGGASAELTASYLADAPRDLLDGLLRLRSSARTAQVTWVEEPGEYRWILHRSGADVSLRVRWFDDWPNHRSDDSGTEILTAGCELSTLIRGVTAGMSRLLRTVDRTGYESRWGHPFPTTALARLNTPPDDSDPDRPGRPRAGRSTTALPG